VSAPETHGRTRTDGLRLASAVQDVVPDAGRVGAPLTGNLLIGALPTWSYSSGWGYYPSGDLGLVLLVLLILALTGRL
jgi:hypothetical protein